MDDKYDEMVARALLHVCLLVGVITVTASLLGGVLLYGMGYD